MPRKKRITKKLLFTKTVEIMQPLLGLSDWKLTIRFTKRIKHTADCEAYPEYKEAIIRMNALKLPVLSQWDIVATACHEMMHCIVWPYSEFANDLCKKDTVKLEVSRKLEEGLVTNLEKIMMQSVVNAVVEVLDEQKYTGIDLTFTELQVRHTD